RASDKVAAGSGHGISDMRRTGDAVRHGASRASNEGDYTRGRVGLSDAGGNIPADNQSAICLVLRVAAAVPVFYLKRGLVVPRQRRSAVVPRLVHAACLSKRSDLARL